MNREHYSALEEALVDTYLQRQSELERSGRLLRPEPSVLSRRARWLVWAGGIELGFVVAAFTTLAVVVVANLIFHVLS